MPTAEPEHASPRGGRPRLTGQCDCLDTRCRAACVLTTEPQKTRDKTDGDKRRNGKSAAGDGDTPVEMAEEGTGKCGSVRETRPGERAPAGQRLAARFAATGEQASPPGCGARQTRTPASAGSGGGCDPQQVLGSAQFSSHLVPKRQFPSVGVRRFEGTREPEKKSQWRPLPS